MKKVNVGISGITLISLVVTIIVLIILAGITISIILNIGMIKRAQEAADLHEVASIQERLELVKAPVQIDKWEVTIDDYLAQADKENLNFEITQKNRVDEENAYITVNDKHEFLLEHEENGNLKITYQGKVKQLKPRINNIDLTKGVNTITATVDAVRAESYNFYIKEGEQGTYVLKESNNTTGIYEFTDLNPDITYYIKVEAINNKGSVDKEIIGEIHTISVENPEWNASSNKATMQINTITIGQTIQYSLDENTWIDIQNGQRTTEQPLGTIIYAKLLDSTTGRVLAHTQGIITDGVKPEAPKLEIVSGTLGLNGYYITDVEVRITEGIDNESGANKTTYILTGATIQEETEITSGQTITITNTGTTVIKAYTYDNASNKSTETILEIKRETSQMQEANITISGATTRTSLPATLTAEVEHIVPESGIDINSCRYVLNNSNQSIGTSASSYTGGNFTSNNQQIPLSLNSATSWYLHVLTVSNSGRLKETIKGPITVTANRHAHSGSSSAVGGCYVGTTTQCTGVKIVTSTTDYALLLSCNVCHYDWGSRGKSDGSYVDNYDYQGPCTRNVTTISLGCGKTAGATIDSYSVSY